MATRSITTRSRTWSRQRVRENIAGYLFILPWIIGFLIFVAGAMIFSLGLSFFNADMLTTAKFVGFDNYRQLFLEDNLWWTAVKNTAYYTFVGVPLHVVLALAIALLLNQQIIGLSVFRTIYYLPAVVSGVAVAILWIWLLHPEFGLINGFLGMFGIRGPNWLFSETWAMPALIIMSCWGIGSSMVIFLAGLQGVPQALYDAARVDGANSLATFWHVTVPMITPTIFFSVVMGIISSFQMFTQAFIMTKGGPNNATITAVMHIYRRAFEQFHFGYASALAWVLFAIILVFTLLTVRSSAAWVYYEGEVRKG